MKNLSDPWNLSTFIIVEKKFFRLLECSKKIILRTVHWKILWGTLNGSSVASLWKSTSETFIFRSVIANDWEQALCLTTYIIQCFYLGWSQHIRAGDALHSLLGHARGNSLTTDRTSGGAQPPGLPPQPPLSPQTPGQIRLGKATEYSIFL